MVMNFKGVIWTACTHSTNSRRLPVTAQVMGTLDLVSSTCAMQSSLCKHLTGSGWGTPRLPSHSGLEGARSSLCTARLSLPAEGVSF